MNEESDIQVIYVFKQCFSVTLVIILMIGMYMASSQDSTNSYQLTKEILRWFNAKNVEIGQANHLFRKALHFIAFFILSLLSYTAFSQFLVRYKFRIMFTSLFCLIIAASDEFHQGFVAGRGPMVSDVLLDFLGALLGIFILILFRWVKKIRQ